MKIILFFIVLITFVKIPLLNTATLYEPQILLQKWLEFKINFGKIYENNFEEIKRLEIWKSNLEYIEKHNAEADAGRSSFWLKMNKFGDLKLDEFILTYTGYNPSLNQKNPKIKQVLFKKRLEPEPKSVDLRKLGFVTPVKDQGNCSASWAFSTTGTLEGLRFWNTRNLTALSEQNLIDCSKGYGNHGCTNGSIANSLLYVMENGGIDTNDSYPYYATDHMSCQFDPNNVGVRLRGFAHLMPYIEWNLEIAVAQQPIAAVIDANHTSFQFYSHGVYHEPACNSTNLNHGVLIVGYGTKDIIEHYWIVKNSWSTAWGEAGYILMARNRNNNCGISSDCSYAF